MSVGLNAKTSQSVNGTKITIKNNARTTFDKIIDRHECEKRRRKCGRIQTLFTPGTMGQRAAWRNLVKTIAPRQDLQPIILFKTAR